MGESFPRVAAQIPGDPFHEKNTVVGTPGVEQSVISFNVSGTKRRLLSVIHVVSRFDSVWKLFVDSVEVARLETSSGAPTAVRVFSPVFSVDKLLNVELKCLVGYGPAGVEIHAGIDGGEVNA